MYNRILLPLLDDNPRKTITVFGIKIRKVIFPLVKCLIPLSVKRKLVVISPTHKYKEPVIYVSTHEFREDAEAAYNAAGVPLYIVNGSVNIVMHSFDGITNWIVGMILIDRSNKKSRNAAKDKMIYAIQNGANILIYPEGTWNKSPNQIISGLFPGVYVVAKETGARVVPIANHRTDKVIYSIMGEAFDVSELSQEDAMETIKERLSTLRYELIEKYDKDERKNYPTGRDLERYWQNHIDALMAEVPYYDYELEMHTKYREKGVTLPNEAFDFFTKIKPSMATAFLYRNNEKWWNRT